MAEKHFLIICGEASGDLNAAGLARNLRQINPELRISAVGGEFLRAVGAEIFYDIKGLSVIGLFDALKKLPLFFALKKLILKKIRAEKPDAIILVDFSGFNLRLAKAIKKTIPVIYYISPQVWASRAGRINTIKKYIHKMVVLFKFEEVFYKKYGVEAECAGYPLLDIVQPSDEKRNLLSRLNFSENKTTIALLPGSRKTEIKHILPVMLEAAMLIRKSLTDTQFVIAKSPQVEMEIYQRFSKKINLDLKIIEGKTYDCLNIADFCLVASGTATLETAIMEKPFLVIYKMGLLNYLLYRPQVKLKDIGMVNIVAGRKIVPEFIQFQASPQKIAECALKIIRDLKNMSRIKNDLAGVKTLLGEKGASARAARIILTFLPQLKH